MMFVTSIFAVSCSSSNDSSNTGGSGGSSSTGGAGGGSGICATLTNYVATTTKTPSFATDVYPIISDTNPSGRAGCAQTSICHGSNPTGLSTLTTATLSFVSSTPSAPSDVLAALMKASVNAPTMNLVVASNVAKSFIAYKISNSSQTDADALACVSSSCTSTSVNADATHPCGVPMPSAGAGSTTMLSATDRTTILDWIAKGANP
jgi:hypothetical protein